MKLIKLWYKLFPVLFPREKARIDDLQADAAYWMERAFERAPR